MKSNSGRHLILTAFQHTQTCVSAHTCICSHMHTQKHNTVNAGLYEFYIIKYCISLHSNAVLYHVI